jgi:ferritin
MKRGPSDPVPRSGHRIGLRNIRKARSHAQHTIEILEHALKHQRRVLERIKAEQWALEDKE